jgi:hypothetical protein
VRPLLFVMFAACGRIDFDIGNAPGDAVTLQCGPAYVVVPGQSSRYRFATLGADAPWIVAESDCESDGGHLIVIDDNAENTWLTGELTARNSGDTWVGASDHVSEGSFKWVTGSAVGFATWDINEPNNSGGIEDCVETLAGGFWNDAACSHLMAHVCECDRIAIAAPHTYCDTDLPASCGECANVCSGTQACNVQSCN